MSRTERKEASCEVIAQAIDLLYEHREDPDTHQVLIKNSITLNDLRHQLTIINYKPRDNALLPGMDEVLQLGQEAVDRNSRAIARTWRRHRVQMNFDKRLLRMKTALEMKMIDAQEELRRTKMAHEMKMIEANHELQMQKLAFEEKKILHEKELEKQKQALEMRKIALEVQKQALEKRKEFLEKAKIQRQMEDLDQYEREDSATDS